MSRNTIAVVLLVRHGRTALNAEGKLRGHADPELDGIGLAQVESTARALSRYEIRRVISSPLRRATATADAIVNATGATFAVDRGFIDRDYGKWTAHPKAEVIEKWGSLDGAPGVEPAAALLERVQAGLNRHYLRGVTVAIVTHDAIIRALLRSIEPGIDPTVDTASWAVLERDETDWHIQSVDNTAEAPSV